MVKLNKSSNRKDEAMDSDIAEIDEIDSDIDNEEEEIEADPYSLFRKRVMKEKYLIHAQIVLSAITEIIQPNNSKIAYFGVLMTTLKTSIEDNKDNSQASLENIAAISYLISLIIKNISKNILQSKYNDIIPLFNNILQLYHDQTFIIKPIIFCLCYMLQIFDTFNSIAANLFQTLLQYSIENKVSLRKEAQLGLHEYICYLSGNYFLTGAPIPNGLITILKNYTTSCLKNGSHSGLQCLNFIGSVLSVNIIPIETTHFIVDCIMKSLSVFKDDIYYKTALKCLAEFTKKMDQSDTVLNSMHILAPNVNEGNCIDFLNAYENVPFTLAGFEIVLSMLGSQNKDISSKAESVCLNILTKSKDSIKKSNFSKDLGRLVTPILHGKYKPVWISSFKIIKYVIEEFGKKENFESFNEVIFVLGNIYEYDQLEDSPIHISNLKKLLTICIDRFGPENVFKVLPLALPADEAALTKLGSSRSWLLPLIKTVDSSLGFFFENLFPYAVIIHNLLKSPLVSGQSVQKSLLVGISNDIWNCFPAFCVCPRDLDTDFKKHAKTLGSYLKTTEFSYTWTAICKGLNNLALSCMPVVVKEQLDDDEDENEVPEEEDKHRFYSNKTLPSMKAALITFSKNFLPILFERTSVLSKDRSEILNAIKHLAAISDSTLVNQSFKSLVTKINPDISPVELAMLVDVMLGLCESLNTENLSLLVQVITPYISGESDPAVQKTAYKIMSRLCKPYFSLETNLKGFFDLWTNAMPVCHANAKKERLKVLLNILPTLTDKAVFLEHFSTILVEVVLCLKDMSEKSRVLAFDILGYVANYCKKENMLNDVFLMVIAGLAGTTPHMQSCAVLALSKLLIDFNQDLPREFFLETCEGLLLLYNVKSQEVIKALVGCTKFILQLWEELNDHVRGVLVKGLFFWSDSHIKFKNKIKVLLSICIRRFGFDFVAQRVPAAAQPFWQHFVKQLERNKKKKAKGSAPKSKSSKDSDDDLSDFDDEDDDDVKGPKGSKSNKVWIDEAEDMDLLDPMASSAFHSSMPKKQSSKKDDDFKTDVSGKLDLMNLGGFTNDAMDESDDSDADEGDKSKTNKTNSKKAKGNKNDADGSVYKSSRAQGDRKVKGKPEPYAFIQLDPKLMNKRKKSEAGDRWEQVMVKAAKKGADKGRDQWKKNKK